VDSLFITFNPVTVVTAVVAGLLFGYFAFMPLVRLVIDSQEQTAGTRREAAVSSFVIIAFIVGAIVTVFYAEQLGTEVAVGVAINGVQPFEALPWRGLGRYLTFLVFDVAFAFAVAMSVWRGYKTGS
jgi:hypothetical protein